MIGRNILMLSTVYRYYERSSIQMKIDDPADSSVSSVLYVVPDLSSHFLPHPSNQCCQSGHTFTGSGSADPVWKNLIRS